jgi:flavin-dependent dehydrogenase
VKSRVPNPEQVLEEELALCPALQDRIRDAERVAPVRVLRDFSYVSERLAGDGWIMAGDAFGFLDPIYSSGVFLALKSAEYAADAIDRAFTKDDFSAASLGMISRPPRWAGSAPASSPGWRRCAVWSTPSIRATSASRAS